jgi:hypothetical protein
MSLADFMRPARISQQRTAHGHQIKISPVVAAKKFVEGTGRRGFTFERRQKISRKPD